MVRQLGLEPLEIPKHLYVTSSRVASGQPDSFAQGESEREAESLYGLISELSQCLFCHILFLRGELLRLTYSRGELDSTCS